MPFASGECGSDLAQAAVTRLAMLVRGASSSGGNQAKFQPGGFRWTSLETNACESVLASALRMHESKVAGLGPDASVARLVRICKGVGLGEAAVLGDAGGSKEL